MTMSYLEQRLLATDNEDDTKRAYMVDVMLESRGEDIPLPPEALPPEDAEIKRYGIPNKTVTEMVGELAMCSDDASISRADLMRSTGYSEPTISRAARKLIQAQLLEEGPELPHAGSGRGHIELRKAPDFRAQASAEPAWRHEIEIRELMRETGFSREQVLDHAFQLVRRDLEDSPFTPH